MARLSAALSLASFVIIISIHVSRAFQWEGALDDGTLKYACEGDDVALPWNYTVQDGETVINNEILYAGIGTEVLVASVTHGQFLPSPGYVQHVQQIQGLSVRLTNVTSSHSGNYSLLVSVVGSAGYHQYRRTVLLHVATESTATVDVTLKVSQLQEAVYDQQTGRYHIQLLCSSQGSTPPDNVTWTTPSGDQVGSLAADGNFTYLIPNPVEGGNYSCHVPSNAAAAKCVPRNSSALQGASIFIDKTESRLALVEAEIGGLWVENHNLKNENAELRASNDNLTHYLHGLEEALRFVNPNVSTVIENYYNNLTHSDETIKAQMSSLELTLTTENSKLKMDNADLKGRVYKLEMRLNVTEDLVEENIDTLTQLALNSTGAQDMVRDLNRRLTDNVSELNKNQSELAGHVDKLVHELENEDSRLSERQANLTDTVLRLQSEVTAVNEDMREGTQNLTEFVQDVEDHLLQEETSLQDYTRTVAQNLTEETRHLREDDVSLSDYVQKMESNLSGFIHSVESSLKTENEGLRKDNAQLNESLTSVGTSLLKVAANLTEMTRDLQGAMASQLAESQANLTDYVKSLDNKLSQTNADLVQSQQTIQRTLDEASHIMETQANITQHIDDVETALRLKEESFQQAANNRLSQLEAAQSRLSENDTRLSQQVFNTETSLQDLETGVIVNLTQHVHDLQTAVTQNQIQFTQNAQVLAGNLTELSALQTERDANLTARVEGMEATLRVHDQLLTETSGNMSRQVGRLESSLAQDKAAQTQALQTLHADLTSENSQLKQQTSELADFIRDLAVNSTLERGHLKDEVLNVTAVLSSLEADMKSLYSRQDSDQTLMEYVMEHLNRSSASDVSFHARLGQTSYPHLQQGDVIKLNDTIDNQGRGYNPATGLFTAPVAGTYFFVATTSSYMTDTFAKMDLVVEGTAVAYASTKFGDSYEMGTCHVVVRLGQGQKVWLRSSGEGYFAPVLTAFSGFLIKGDAST